MDYQLKIISEGSTNRYTLCDGNDNFYTINSLLYDILYAYKENNNYKAVCDKINKKRTDNFLAEEFVEESIKKAISVLDKKPSGAIEAAQYIRHKFTLVKDGGAMWLYRILSVLFNRIIFSCLLPFSLIASIYYLYKNGFTSFATLRTSIETSISVYNSVICYALFLIIIFIHELGHASATYKFGVKPKEIGAGLYFIFPVLYTNVTHIWTLKMKDRIIVNLGGIYFQLLINLILITLLFINYQHNICLMLFLANTSSIMVSFNPFFRYDGYWIFSDLFKISNLREKSTKFLWTCITAPKRVKQYIVTANVSFATMGYSICNAVFWLSIYFSLAKYVVTNIPALISLLSKKQYFNINTITIIAACLFVFIWFFSLITSFILTILKPKNYVK